MFKKSLIHRFVMTCLAFIATHANAHSEVTDSIMQIPVGTKFIVTTPINVKPKVGILSFINGRLLKNGERTNGLNGKIGTLCLLSFAGSDQDRELVSEYSLFITSGAPYSLGGQYTWIPLGEDLVYLAKLDPFEAVLLEAKRRNDADSNIYPPRAALETNMSLTCKKCDLKDSQKCNDNFSIQDVQNALGKFFRIEFPSPSQF